MENLKVKTEYIIYTYFKNATPYILGSFFNINQAKLKLYEIIENDKERRFKYYVDNDFFENPYRLENAEMYYCIKFREVMPYKKYYEFEHEETDVNAKNYAKLKKNYEKQKKRESEKIIPFFTI